MTVVMRPVDNLFRVSGLAVDSSKMKTISVPGMNEPIYEVASAYRLRSGDLLTAQIDEVHPAWWYSGEDYNSLTLDGTCTFRANPSDKGEQAYIRIPNPKLEMKSSNLSNIELNRGLSRDMDIPVQYSGTTVVDSTPTVISAQITSADVVVHILSPVEFEIEVLNTLSEEVHFSVPVSSPRLTNSTIWGEIGDESTLPTDAVVGLVKIKTEAKLTTENGLWKDDEARRLFTMAPYTKNLITLNTTSASGPTWYQNILPLIEAEQPYKDFEAFVERPDTSFYKLGYEQSTVTAGTGIFVSHTNQARVIPWANMTEGYAISRNIPAADLTDELTLREALDFSAFRTNFLDLIGTGGGLTRVENGHILPVAAADLQAIKLASAMYSPIDDSRAIYPNKTPSIIDQVTPIYIPAQSGYHCFTPAQTYTQGFRIHQLTSRNLDETVSLWMTADSGTFQIYGTGGNGNSAPVLTHTDRFQNKAELQAMGWSSMAFHLPFFKRRFGFSYGLRVYSYNRWISTSATRTFYNYHGAYGFINDPTSNFTIGAASTATDPTLIPVYSVMSNMCVGKLAAGTAAGTYKFKPFKTYTIMGGVLDARNPVYNRTEVLASIEGDRTNIPYFGLNIITIETSKIRWIIG